MLWAILGAMLLAAIFVVAWPMLRGDKDPLPSIKFVIVPIVLMSAALYYHQGRPDVPSGASEPPAIEDMVASLAERLQQNPNDLDGWIMLGRSYMTLENFAGAVDAYERAVALESPQRADTLASLGRALLARDEGQVVGRPAALFESALAIEPNHPWALFFGGVGARNRGDLELAATRWEILQGINTDPRLDELLTQGIAQWRGLPPPQPTMQPTPEREGTVLSVAIELDATATVAPNAVVFIIARDPAQPSPPIAVARRQVAELPTVVALSDADSMIPGRSLSAFAEVEVVARVSVSGQPIAQSGDWFASSLVKPAESDRIELTIDQQVP